MSSAHTVTRRQRLILEYVREHGTAQVDELARQLEVTPQTIRRDLNQLYDSELIQRVHGGAILKDTVENLGHGARQLLMSSEKNDIAARVAELIPDSSSIFINIGTTTEKVAEHIRHKQGMLVITNNINVASLLWPYKGYEVMIAGGTIRHNDGGIVGPSTEEFIGKFKVDFAIIGCSAIDEDGEFFDYDLREVRVTQSIIRRARSVVLVTDSMKFERRAPVSVGNLSEIDILVTDDGLPASFAQRCSDWDVKLELVPHQGRPMRVVEGN